MALEAGDALNARVAELLERSKWREPGDPVLDYSRDLNAAILIVDALGTKEVRFQYDDTSCNWDVMFYHGRDLTASSMSLALSLCRALLLSRGEITDPEACA